jgi:predicted nucleic acid-binding Zn ribbon protein
MDTIKAVLEKVIGTLQEKNQQDPIMAAWEKCAGKKIRMHSQPLGIWHKSLRVAVDSSAWLYEMNLNKKALLQQLTAQGLKIKDITFRIGKVN